MFFVSGLRCVFVSGLRKRWAVGKEECVSGIEKRVIFGGAPGVSRFGEVESDFDTGALRNICSRKEFRRGASP